MNEGFNFEYVENDMCSKPCKIVKTRNGFLGKIFGTHQIITLTGDREWVKEEKLQPRKQ
jgi:hypothetical protein